MDGQVRTFKSEEEGAGSDDEEEGQVEDSLLPGHHHPPIAAESVFPRQFLPFSHLSCYHYSRHDDLYLNGCKVEDSNNKR